MNEPKDLVWLGEQSALCKDVLLIVTHDTKTVFDEKRIDPMYVSDYRIAPWGVENNLPQKVMDLIEAAEIVGTNAQFNWKAAYGLGPRLVRVIRDTATHKITDVHPVVDGEAHDWFVNNNVPLLLMEILTDLTHFGNAFPVLIADKAARKFSGIRHREAIFSRWGIDERKQITKHLYCGKWDEMPTKDDIEESYVIDELDAYNDAFARLVLGRDDRMCFPIFLPCPGRPYYSYPSWWSIFRSGWYDNVVSIPGLKKAILKHNLGVKHIIYISESYISDKAAQMKIAADDIEGIKKLKQDLIKEISDYLTGEANAGKPITSIKKMVPSGNGTTIEKYIEIETVKNDISGGEYLTDYETGANIISYAMEVHPSLIGATPGKNSNSLSGSNIREIFIMKQSLSKPLTYLALQWWPLVRRINGWDSDIEIMMQDSLFTTLDQSKSGEVKIQTEVAQ